MTRLLSCIALALAASRSIAQAPPRWAPAVDSLVRLEMARTLVPGAQIAIVRNGQVVYTQGYGVADIETGRPVSDRTLFQTGSVMKLATAILLAQLSSNGTLDLQAPVSRYVTELAGRRAGTATLHQLLTHSAGWTTEGNSFGRMDDAALGDVFRLVSDTIMMTEPGRVPSYSNTGFSMAGYAAERASGRRFADLVDSLVIRPLRLTRATFRPTVAMTYDFSQGHSGPLAEPGRVQRPMPGNAADWPSGFLYVSAGELGRLAAALMDDGMIDGMRVFSSDAVRKVTTGHVAIPGESVLRYGYGLTVDRAGQRRVWQKNGYVSGFDALVTMWPDDRLAIVVMANRTTTVMPPSVTSLAARIVAGIEPADTAVYRADRDPTPEEAEQLAGTYRLGRTSIVVAAVPTGVLTLRVANRTSPARLTRDGTRLIVGALSDSVMHPYVIVRDPDGRVRFLYRDNGRAYAKEP